MSIGGYYARGLREAARRPKTIFILWALNALGGLAVYFAAAGLMRRAFGSSLMAGSLNESFVFRGVMELLQAHGRGLAALGWTVLLVTAATLLLSLFLSGGVLHVLSEGRGGRSGAGRGRERAAAMFFEGAGRYFGRFVRLEIFAVPMWIAFGLLMMILAAAAGSFTAGGERERLGFILMLVLAGIAAALFISGRMIIDYARIRIVATDTAGVMRALAGTWGFAARKFLKMLGLYALFVLTTAAVYAAGEAAGIFLGGGKPIAAAAGFGLQQALILLLLGVRVGLLAAQTELSRVERVDPLDLSTAAQNPGGEHE
jgi:hypothetical protein